MMKGVLKLTGAVALTGALTVPFVEGFANIKRGKQAIRDAVNCTLMSVGQSANSQWKDGIELQENCVGMIANACDAQVNIGGGDIGSSIERRLDEEVCQSFLDQTDIANCQTVIQSAVDRCRQK